MLEAIARLRRHAARLDQSRVDQAIEGSLQGGFIEFAHQQQQGIVEIAPQHSADLRYFTRPAQHIQPGRQRRLQGRWDLLAIDRAFQQQASQFFDKQRHAAGAADQDVDDIAIEQARCNLTHHGAHVVATQRRQRNGGVVRAMRPLRAKLRPRRHQYQCLHIVHLFGQQSEHA